MTKIERIDKIEWLAKAILAALCEMFASLNGSFKLTRMQFLLQ